MQIDIQALRFWLVLLIMKNGSHLSEPSAKVYKIPSLLQGWEEYYLDLCFFMIRQSVCYYDYYLSLCIMSL